MRMSVERSWKRLRNSSKGPEFLHINEVDKMELIDVVVIRVAEDLTESIHHLQPTGVVLDMQLSRD